MLDALRASGLRRAVWLAGPCAWIQSKDGLSARLAGAGGNAFVLDLGSAHGSRDSIFGGRILRLRPGERFELDAPAPGGGTARSGPDGPAALSTVPGKRLDERLDGFPWDGANGKDPGNAPIPGQAVELRGKGSRLRLFRPPTGADHGLPPSARSQQADWIWFDWIQPA
jgi:hypothetical protein